MSCCWSELASGWDFLGISNSDKVVFSTVFQPSWFLENLRYSGFFRDVQDSGFFWVSGNYYENQNQNLKAWGENRRATKLKNPDSQDLEIFRILRSPKFGIFFQLKTRHFDPESPGHQIDLSRKNFFTMSELVNKKNFGEKWHKRKFVILRQNKYLPFGTYEERKFISTKCETPRIG